MAVNLDDLLQRLSGMDKETLEQTEALIEDATGNMLWTPNPGPQLEAYNSTADVMLYGGQAGGGKTHLELGWGINVAHSGIIFRRETTQTDGLEKEGKIIIGDTARFNGQDLEWTWPDGRTLKLGGISAPDDWLKHAGRERDYMAFDEAGEFLETQVSQIIAWLRAPKGRRTRVILGSNPPRRAEGFWLLKWFAPWLDDKYPGEPALPGGIRWAIYVTKDDESFMVWVDGPGEYTYEGDQYIAKSYTFIPASLHDNPERNTPEYRAQLQSLPEPLRSQLLYGKFTAGLNDAANQCIPTEWVRAAMARWKPGPPKGIPMCSIGVDCTGGGNDPMVQAIRYDYWFDRLDKTPGKEIPAEKAGAIGAGLILKNRRDNALVVVDMGGGYGGPIYEHLCNNDVEVFKYVGAEKTHLKSEDSKLKFTNTRSAAYWRLREALDPGQHGGSNIALPSDNRLLAGLTAPSFEVTPGGIKVEPKVIRDQTGKVKGGVMAKLGFSPDEADAVVQAWFKGPRYKHNATDFLDFREQRSGAVKVVGPSRQPLSARRKR